MSASKVDADELKARLATPATVLVDFWAPWCAPCKQQAPAVHRVAQALAGELEVLMLDVDENKDYAAELAVRSIPCLVLFRAGQEVARKTGLQGEAQLLAWLGSNGVDARRCMDAARLAEATAEIHGGAFYGDTSLREFLVKRLLAQAEAGEVVGSRFPRWDGSSGSVSTALVRHDSPEVFTRVSGLPASLGAAMHFAWLETADQLRPILAATPAGADLRRVPLDLLVRWLGDDELPWPQLLGPEPDALRQDWLALASRLPGGPPEQQPQPDWSTLRARARQLLSRDPDKTAADNFARLIEIMSPPPADEDAQGWYNVFALYGIYFHIVFGKFAHGWAVEDFGVEVRRENWFRAECPDPGSLTTEQMDALHARRQVAQSDMDAAIATKELAAHEHGQTWMAEQCRRVQHHLRLALLDKA